MSLRLASISIDLDEVPRYAAIHGFEAPRGQRAHAVYDRCVPRLTAWLDDESIRATFFAIGEDLERDENRETIAALHAAGHEIGNHSYHHHYDLTRRAVADIRDDIERGADESRRPAGSGRSAFARPGTRVSDPLFSALEASGVEYDSSVFPCPSYYAAKAAALAAIKLRGRKSASILDSRRCCGRRGSRTESGGRTGERGDGLLELPIGVTPLQLPYIGTSLVLGGERIAERLSKQMLGRELINLELHGFDVADAVRGRTGSARTAPRRLETDGQPTSFAHFARRFG